MEDSPNINQLKMFTIRGNVIAAHTYLFPNVIEIRPISPDNNGHDEFVQDLDNIHQLYPEPPPDIAA